MKKRDSTRQNIRKVEKKEKIIMMEQYKKLRNKVNAKLRAESIDSITKE